MEFFEIFSEIFEEDFNNRSTFVFEVELELSHEHLEALLE